MRVRCYEPPDDPTGTVFDPADSTFGPIMAAIQSGNFEEAAALLTTLTMAERRKFADPPGLISRREVQRYWFADGYTVDVDEEGDTLTVVVPDGERHEHDWSDLLEGGSTEPHIQTVLGQEGR